MKFETFFEIALGIICLFTPVWFLVATWLYIPWWSKKYDKSRKDLLKWIIRKQIDEDYKKYHPNDDIVERTKQKRP